MTESSSSSKRRICIPLNRVEGDLEIRLDVQGGVVQDAWSAGILYRGFENLLTGRAPLDSLVITPRICGICSTAQLLASVRALEALAGVVPPPNARRARFLALMVEHIQSDMRHCFLQFAPDFIAPVYRNFSFFEEAGRRYRPLQGQVAVETIQQTRRFLEIIAILGGQWPHSSFMIPGGITGLPKPVELLQCYYLVDEFRRWYEGRVLGCTLERWRAVNSAAALEAWLEEKESQRNSEVGFFLQCARAIGLDRLGRGPENFLHFSEVDAGKDASGADLSTGGVWLARQNSPESLPTIQPLDHNLIYEHVGHSWFVDDGPRHPFEGRTYPQIDSQNGRAYSWAKAPRYAGVPMETGPLAGALVECDPLMLDLFKTGGGSIAMLRQLARLVRPARYLGRLEATLVELVGNHDPYYQPVPGGPGGFDSIEGQGAGLVDASRGLLGHWVKIRAGRISHYQVITPTAWNGSPRDDQGQSGPWEQALAGIPVDDPENPVMVGHIVRSFDACMVCTVH